MKPGHWNLSSTKASRLLNVLLHQSSPASLPASGPPQTHQATVPSLPLENLAPGPFPQATAVPGSGAQRTSSVSDMRCGRICPAPIAVPFPWGDLKAYEGGKVSFVLPPLSYTPKLHSPTAPMAPSHRATGLAAPAGVDPKGPLASSAMPGSGKGCSRLLRRAQKVCVWGGGGGGGVPSRGIRDQRMHRRDEGEDWRFARNREGKSQQECKGEGA